MAIDRHNNALCGVCRRGAIGIAYSPDPDRRLIWLCDDTDCIQLARNTYSMKQDEFTHLENLAAQEGAVAGGQYLDTIGKYDLQKLDAKEFAEFGRRVVARYREALVELQGEAPF